MGVNIKSKFRERKRLFRLQREKKKKKLLEEKNKKSRENSIKIILFSPLIFLGFIKNIIEHYSGKRKIVNSKKYSNNDLNNKADSTKIINEIDKTKSISIFNKGKNDIQKNSLIFIKKSLNKKDGVVTNKKENLENKIFIKLKKELIYLQNNNDIIESELYLLNKYANDHEMLEEAQKITKEINLLLERVENIKMQYKLKENANFTEEEILLEDLQLIDDIINYHEKINTSGLNFLSDKLKLFNQYKQLYTKIDDLKTKTMALKTKSDERVDELSKRDKNFSEAKNKIINLDEVNSNCNDIINRHNDYLEDILSKVDKIDERKLVKYKLDGLNGLLTSSLRYIGFLSLTPLRGIIPGIAARTIAARKLVNGMIHNIHFEKYEKTVYELTNYQEEINNKIYDIDSLNENIYLALNEVNNLKEKFKDYFLKYNLKEYDIAYKKIEKIEQDIIKNREKTIIIREKLIKNKELNKNSMAKVKKIK